MAECDHLAPEADQSQGKMTVEVEVHQSDRRKYSDIVDQSQSRKQSILSQKDSNMNHSKSLGAQQS